ncbi:glycosyltransferase family 4 protein [Saccharopolyspora sp. CA-218241]|uniref:glycosyltransferase family 4 protein n=1 Tax=Saccharopolyspora sp. CA-218241 TaxID=3240027 RepID=UPI003D95ABDC
MAEPAVVVDGTPLLGRRTGIGRYTACLLAELAGTVPLRVIGLTARGRAALPGLVPPGARVVGPPVPARALRACWRRLPLPPVELLGAVGDVVHGTNFVLPPSRSPGVLTVHDLAFLDDPALAEPDLPALVRRSARRAAVVCTPTAAVAEVVRTRLDVPAERIAVTPLGVDPAWSSAAPLDAEARARLGVPGQYLLFVGAGGSRKGLPVLLRALSADLPPLVVAGPAAAGELTAPDGAVTRTGYLDDDVLRGLVAGAAALVLPSRDEGFGLPALEALACGVPVVCSDVPALREVTGGHADLVPPGDPEALREALRTAAARPRDATSDAARRAHAAGFTWRACAEATRAAYHRAART